MASTPTSPKVTAGASTAAIVGLILSYVQATTPDSFAFLGRYQGIAFLLVTLAGGAFAAWWKTDPLRATPPAPVDTVAVPQETVAAIVATPAAPVATLPAMPSLKSLLTEPAPVPAPVEVTPIYEATQAALTPAPAPAQ